MGFRQAWPRVCSILYTRRECAGRGPITRTVRSGESIHISTLRIITGYIYGLESSRSEFIFPSRHISKSIESRALF